MIRLILVLSAVALYLILSLPVLFYLRSLEKKDAAAATLKSLNMVRWILGIVRNLAGITCEVRGLENIPKYRAVLYVGNHRSYFDIVMGYTTVPSPTGFIAKKEMQKVPFIRLWMKYLHCLFMDRSNPREGLKTILSGVEQINNGISIVIFPEGTRNKGDGIMPFHGGSFKLADKSNCKIIPMVQNNTENVLEAHFPSIKRTHTVLEFGTPIDTAALDRDERKALPDTVHDLMLQIYEKNKSLV